ncbi:MAG: VTT domain-containing protein [Chloroflexi bacterium]|nr:VTT domain-containing protein [Chloroflexota bacterium]
MSTTQTHGFLSWWHRYGVRLAALAFSILVTALIVLFRNQLRALAHYGYLGIFLISALGNATVVFPVPSLAVVFAGGGVFNPVLVGLVAGLGEPLGELTGYLAGYGGSAVVENGGRFAAVRSWMARRGFLTLFVLSAIPNPLFDLAGITAGMLHYPIGKFLLACWLGKTTKALIIAALGALSINLLTPWLG